MYIGARIDICIEVCADMRTDVPIDVPIVFVSTYRPMCVVVVVFWLFVVAVIKVVFVEDEDERGKLCSSERGRTMPLSRKSRCVGLLFTITWNLK